MKKVPPVKEIYKKASKNVLNPNTVFTEEIWHARYFGRKVATYFTWLFLHTNITPNGVTVIAISCGMIGSLFFAYPTIPALIIGIILFELYLILDSSDGELARYKKQFSLLGEYLDTLGHILIYSCLYIAMGINVSLRSGNYIYTIIGLLTALFYSIAASIHHNDPILKNKTYLESRKGEGSTLHLGKNIYNFLTEDLNIAFAIVIFGLLQYLNIIKTDVILIILVLNAILLLFGGIILNIALKIKDPRYDK
jgi:phosphatidylglycerophosphate synthase